MANTSAEGWTDWAPGSGKEFSACLKCSGRGKCRVCEGRGLIEGNICTACKGSGKCSECGGTGKVKKKEENKSDKNPYTAPPSPTEYSSSPKAGGPKGPRGWFKRKARDLKENYNSDKEERKKDRLKNSEDISQLGGQFLILVTLVMHVIDALVFQFSIRPGVLATRFFMYLILMTIAHIVLKHENIAQSAHEFYPWFILSGVLVPVLSGLLRLIGVPEAILVQISAVVVAIPVWLFYFMYVRGLNYKYQGKSLIGWIFYWLTPIGLARIWFMILVISVLVLLFNSLAFTAENIPGADRSGYDILQGAEEVRKTIAEAGKTAVNNILGINTGFGNKIDKIYNDTLGQYYTGRVEENKEKTGVFITEFQSKDTHYDSQPIYIYGLITARSFVDNINMNLNCSAQDVKNLSVIIQGIADPDKITIYQQDQQGVICKFDKLPAGDYRVTLTADFNFETWAYTTYTFMDRDFLNSIRIGGEDVNTKFNIIQKPTTIYTNGPIMLGMNENLYMPISLTTNVSETNRVPMGMTIQNKQVSSATKGTVKNVNEFQLRVPTLFTLDSCTKTVTSPQRDTISEDYHVYTFTNDRTDLSQSYMSVSCNLIITPTNAIQLLGLTGGKAVVSLVGTAKYDYELSRQTTIKVNKDPTT